MRLSLVRARTNHKIHSTLANQRPWQPSKGWSRAIHFVCYAYHRIYETQVKRALVRVDGIEPTTSAWKADVLPLNYTRKQTNKTQNT